jgi:hydroxyquinol 1,2-dioxygenase
MLLKRFDTLSKGRLSSQNNHKPAGCTESTVLGPFYVAEPPTFHNGADIANGALGTPCFVSGTVSGPNGQRISGALIDVWQSDEDGFYDVQRPARDGLIVPQARGRLETLSNGSFHFKSILAEAYPIPHDGPVGKMLAALGRHPWRPAHLHFWIRAEGFDPLITHIFRAGDKYIDSDAVFGVRSSLIVDWKHHDPGVTPDGSVSQTSFYTVAYDFVLSELDKVTEPVTASVSAAG